MRNHIKKKNFIHKFILINFMFRFFLTCCFEPFWSHDWPCLTTPTWNGWMNLLYPLIPYHMLKAKVIRNGKIVWQHEPYYWHFRLNLKYLGWPYRAYIKTAKNGNFWEELLSENNFEAVLATSCCYDHGAKASEAVQKIATDQKEYRKCSSCVIICWKATVYISINNSEKWLVTRIPPT